MEHIYSILQRLSDDVKKLTIELADVKKQVAEELADVKKQVAEEHADFKKELAESKNDMTGVKISMAEMKIGSAKQSSNPASSSKNF